MVKEIDKYGECPVCGESWNAGTIFDAFRKQECYNLYTDEELQKKIEKLYSKPYHFSKLIGIEIRDVYDGVSQWQCPFCKSKWDRWTGDLLFKGEVK